jgi:predicted GIY-YIG superfamily endonuclease
MSYFVYILRSSWSQLYIGQTNNLNKRINQHVNKDSKAAKFTRDGNNFKLVHSERYSTRLEAMKREAQLKGWSRAKKEALIAGESFRLKELGKRKTKPISI